MATLHRLRSADEPGFDQLIRFYEDAFPASERKAISRLRSMLADDRYYFFLAMEAAQPVGFSIVRKLAGDTAALLEYMAVATAERNRGLGAQILRATARAVGSPPLTLLLEAESDRTDSPDRLQRTRRKHFYRALGARELEHLSWIMPPVSEAAPPPMEMLVFTPATAISKSQIREWLMAIYGEVYAQPAEDSRIVGMLEVLPDQVALL